MFDFSKVERLKGKADKGDAKAQIEIGREYFSGRNVPANFTKGYAYFAMAARQNDPEALFLIAECQDNGNGCAISPGNAFQNFSKAAKIGHLKATLNLAHYFETGRGGIVDFEKALINYQQAFKLGHASAKDHIARLERLKLSSEAHQQAPAIPSTATRNSTARTKQVTPIHSEIKIDDIPFFKGLGAMELMSLMSFVTNVPGKRGQFLFCEGQPPNGLFIILSGRCSIRLTNLNSSTFTEIKSVSPGGYVGEFGLIDGLPRSATVVVTEDAELMFLPAQAFQVAMGSQKAIAEVVTRNLLAFIRDGNIIIKEKEAKELVYSGRVVEPTLENMQTLTRILRASNSTEQTDYWER
jgi:hypothetical protein